MYYHLLVERTDGKRSEMKDESNLEEIKEIATKYKDNKPFIVKGTTVKPNEVSEFCILSSQNKANYYHERYNPGFLDWMSSTKDIMLRFDDVKDITNKILNEIEISVDIKRKESSFDPKKVFVVYGRTKEIKIEVENFLRKIDLTPVILSDVADNGETIIENIESNIKDCCYGIVIYTPDDEGKLKEDDTSYELRARQNVIFEHGYLCGLLTRKRVSIIENGVSEKPSDILGLKYIKYDENKAWQNQLIKNMKSVGVDGNFDKIFN